MPSPCETNASTAEVESKKWRHPLLMLLGIATVMAGLIGVLGLLFAS